MTITQNYKDLLVFSHLRWEFVLQRPQHIINRLSKNHRVFFIEEPIGYEPHEEGTFKVIESSENVTILQPRIPHHKFTKRLAGMVKALFDEHDIYSPLVWFYSPMFLPVLKKIPHSLVIYDCMDQLSAFKGAPPALLKNEKTLLDIADVVFTGGKSLFDDKKQYNENTHCFPSSVERTHFEKSFSPKLEVPEDMKNIKGPVVGFYGVIDERLNPKLLGEVAKKLPHVSFVLIGPVVKIDPASLPQRDNIHYLGPKNYQELPQYLKYIDIAMMPFALNRSTKYISPTKTLEYMAALKPIVSTPIYDVVRDYAHVVNVVSTPAQFAQAITKFLNETPEQKQLREEKTKQIIDNTSWDKTVKSMEKIISEAYSQVPVISSWKTFQTAHSPLLLEY